MLSTQKITSRDNARLKLARKVRDGKDDQLIFVEGIRLSGEALRSDLSARECVVSTKALKDERVKILAAAVIGNGIKVSEVSEDIFRTIADTDNPQGIILICDRPGSKRKDFEKRFNFSTDSIPVVIFLDEVNNPSNLGAILRTAEAADAAGVIVSKSSADPFSTKATRASMGSVFRLPVWNGVDLGKTVDWAHERGMIVTAADIAGDKVYTHIDWRMPRLLVFGSEAHGLSDNHKKKIEDLISIPISESVESLNLAVSAGVILFEAKRQIGASISNDSRLPVY